MNAELLITVSSAGSAPIVSGLARACKRAGCGFVVFVNHEAVAMLRDADVVQDLAFAESAVVCHDSWRRFIGDDVECPMETGSQTNHSLMIGQCDRVISL